MLLAWARGVRPCVCCGVLIHAVGLGSWCVTVCVLWGAHPCCWPGLVVCDCLCVVRCSSMLLAWARGV